jgi:hypothetical protein
MASLQQLSAKHQATHEMTIPHLFASIQPEDKVETI